MIAIMWLKGHSASYYLLCVVGLPSMLSIMVVNPILSLFAEDIGAPTSDRIRRLGYWVSKVVLEIPSGYVSSRFGYYRPMLFGLTLTEMGNVLLVFVDSAPAWSWSGLNGYEAPFFAVSMTFLVNLFDELAPRWGVFQRIEFVGTIIGSAVREKLVQELGWRGGFMAALALLSASLLFFAVPPTSVTRLSEGHEQAAHPG